MLHLLDWQYPIIIQTDTNRIIDFFPYLRSLHLFWLKSIAYPFSYRPQCSISWSSNRGWTSQDRVWVNANSREWMVPWTNRRSGLHVIKRRYFRNTPMRAFGRTYAQAKDQGWYLCCRWGVIISVVNCGWHTCRGFIYPASLVYFLYRRGLKKKQKKSEEAKVMYVILSLVTKVSVWRLMRIFE